MGLRISYLKSFKLVLQLRTSDVKSLNRRSEIWGMGDLMPESGPGWLLVRDGHLVWSLTPSSTMYRGTRSRWENTWLSWLGLAHNRGGCVGEVCVVAWGRAAGPGEEYSDYSSPS